MRIIKIEANESGSHSNLNAPALATYPDGWAVIPADMTIPASFPFVDIVVVDGVVTEMTAREIPPTPPEPVEPTIDERMDTVEDAIIDTDAVNDEQDDRLSVLEDAVIELANLIGGNA